MQSQFLVSVQVRFQPGPERTSIPATFLWNSTADTQDDAVQWQLATASLLISSKQLMFPIPWRRLSDYCCHFHAARSYYQSTEL